MIEGDCNISGAIELFRKGFDALKKNDAPESLNLTALLYSAPDPITKCLMEHFGQSINYIEAFKLFHKSFAENGNAYAARKCAAMLIKGQVGITVSNRDIDCNINKINIDLNGLIAEGNNIADKESANWALRYMETLPFNERKSSIGFYIDGIIFQLFGELDKARDCYIEAKKTIPNASLRLLGLSGTENALSENFVFAGLGFETYKPDAEHKLYNIKETIIILQKLLPNFGGSMKKELEDILRRAKQANDFTNKNINQIKIILEGIKNE